MRLRLYLLKIIIIRYPIKTKNIIYELVFQLRLNTEFIGYIQYIKDYQLKFPSNLFKYVEELLSFGNNTKFRP